MRGIPQGAGLFVAVALVVAGCGSSASPRSVAAVADCLNDEGFLVSTTGSRIEGSSPGGVNFTLYVSRGPYYASSTVGDPKGEKLSGAALSTIGSCERKHGP